MYFRCGFLTLIACIFCSGIALAQTDTLLSVIGLSRPGGLKVVRIMNEEGGLSFEVIDDEIIRLMKQDLTTRFKKAKQAWSQARDVWKNENPGVPFAMPKPVTPKVTVLKKGFSSRSEAEGELALARSAGPFCIYQVAQGDKKTYKIVSCEETVGRKYRIETEYNTALAEWVEEKKAFEKENSEGEQYSKKMPPKPKFRVIKSRIKTMEKANLQMAKYRK